jgi:NADH:ubiquinone oxidoreductase subunit 6 (subunit J)
MSATSVLFWIFAIATCGSAIAVVVSQNVVRMAFWLIISLGSTAGLFYLLQADFVATAQLLVYVGGTLVLLIFGVMLTASGPYMRMRASQGEGVMAALIGCALLALICASAASVDWEKTTQAATGMSPHDTTVAASKGYDPPEDGTTSRPIGLALVGPRVDRDLKAPPGPSGKLSTGYLLPFEIASVHLLVVLVGAAYLARAKRRVKPAGMELGKS